MDMHDCLPPSLRSPSPTITKIAAGLSGAGVFRVDAAEGPFVLKVARADEPLDEWRRRAGILQLAAAAGIAPRVVHIDENRRAVVSEFVAGESFSALLFTPSTHQRALELLAAAIRRVHELPVQSAGPAADPRAILAAMWREALADVVMPAPTRSAVGRVLSEEMPPTDRPLVLSHNDINPSNIAYDGSRVLLLDWDVAGLNNAWYDIATVAMFFRMDDATSARLIAAYDGAPVAAVPAAFGYFRRMIAALCGSMFLKMAVASGYRAHDGGALTLAEFYQQLREGSVNPATPEGQWQFGLALIGEA